jgi:Spy/CpxP family protein refolding chaperone
MKHFSICICAAALTLTAAPIPLHAADEPKSTQRPARGVANANANPTARLKTAVDDLKLTGDAKTKADDILAKAQEDADKITEESAGDRRAALQKIAEIAKNAGEQINALLDDDQKLMLQSKLQAAAKPGANDPAPGAGPGGAPGASRGAFMMQRMKDVTATLGLSDEQSKRVDAALADLQVKSEEQFTKFEEAMRQPPAGGGAAGGRLAAMLQRFQDAIKDLSLTDDQKPKVQAALAETRKKFTALAPARQAGPPSPEVREKFRTAMEDLRTELMGILTPEQQEKFRASMQQGAGAGARPRPNAGAPKGAEK